MKSRYLRVHLVEGLTRSNTNPSLFELNDPKCLWIDTATDQYYSSDLGWISIPEKVTSKKSPDCPDGSNVS